MALEERLKKELLKLAGKWQSSSCPELKSKINEQINTLLDTLCKEYIYCKFYG